MCVPPIPLTTIAARVRQPLRQHVGSMCRHKSPPPLAASETCKSESDCRYDKHRCVSASLEQPAVRRFFVIDRRRRKSTESFSVRPELLVNRRMDRPDPAMEACPLVTLRYLVDFSQSRRYVVGSDRICDKGRVILAQSRLERVEIIFRILVIAEIVSPIVNVLVEVSEQRGANVLKNFGSFLSRKESNRCAVQEPGIRRPDR